MDCSNLDALVASGSEARCYGLLQGAGESLALAYYEGAATYSRIVVSRDNIDDPDHHVE